MFNTCRGWQAKVIHVVSIVLVDPQDAVAQQAPVQWAVQQLQEITRGVESQLNTNIWAELHPHRYVYWWPPSLQILRNKFVKITGYPLRTRRKALLSPVETQI